MPIAKPQDAAEHVFALLRQGEHFREDAARLMDGLLGRWMDRFFQRMGVSSAEAEELTMDVWLKLLKGDYDVRGNGYALLCRMRRSRFADYVRHRRASKRSLWDSTLSAELALDDDEWQALDLAEPSASPPFELADCVQRKMFVFEQVAPARAELLELLATGLSYREIAGVVFDLDEAEVTTQVVARIRNRIEEARKQAASYFEECQD